MFVVVLTISPKNNRPFPRLAKGGDFLYDKGARSFYAEVVVDQGSAPNVGLVLLFDENMPQPDTCRDGCENDRSCLCIHRFGPGIKIILHSEICSPGVSDLRVLESFIEAARDGVPGASLEQTLWIVITKDQGFFKSARHHHLSRKGNGSKELHFSVPAGCVWTKLNDQTVHVSALSIIAKDDEKGDRKKDDAKRAELLGKTITSVHRLLQDDIAS